MAEEKFKKVVCIKCTQEDMEKIKEMAYQSNRSFSGFISYLIKEYLDRKRFLAKLDKE